jgi:hypothetical protein
VTSTLLNAWIDEPPPVVARMDATEAEQVAAAVGNSKGL